MSSDHRIVTAKIRLNLRRNTIVTIKPIRYDWSSLSNRDNSNKYTTTKTNSVFFRRYLKYILRMKNTKASSMPTWKQPQNVYQTNQQPKRVPWETREFRKKRDNVKKCPDVIKEAQQMKTRRNLRKLKEN